MADAAAATTTTTTTTHTDDTTEKQPQLSKPILGLSVSEPLARPRQKRTSLLGRLSFRIPSSGKTGDSSKFNSNSSSNRRGSSLSGVLKNKSSTRKLKLEEAAPKQLSFNDEIIEHDNALSEPLTEEEAKAYYVTKEDEARIQTEAQLTQTKYKFHRRNPARYPWNDDDVTSSGNSSSDGGSGGGYGSIRGLEDTLSFTDAAKHRKEHVDKVLAEQKKLKSKAAKSQSQSDATIAAALAKASAKTSNKSFAEAKLRAKKDAVSGYYSK